MAGEDKFSLRWNDFESSLSTSFEQFRGSLLDVEILCSSGEVVARITDHQDRNFANFSKQEILSLFHSGGGRLYFVV